MLTDTSTWTSDYEEVTSFGASLVNAGYDVNNLQEYYEKPYKWTDEHTRWVAAGRPEEFDEGE